MVVTSLHLQREPAAARAGLAKARANVPQLVPLVVRPAFGIDPYLQDCRKLTLDEIGRRMPLDTRHTAGLYELILDYPLRPAKALRPALCMGVCLSLGGHLDGALPSAAAFELFHNAFLVHDDVEDASSLRRHGPTLHATYGVPIAVNVGDGMLALAFDPLLDNVRVLGLGPALRILTLFARMARESAEGQMMELDWIRRRRWNLSDRDYLRMVHKKTGWYSFISPVQVGAIAAGADRATVEALGRFALNLGIAFQIQDDLLSLEGSVDAVGKDALGDLWEGKYTLPLLHTLRSVSEPERREALAILARPRPVARENAALEGALLAKLARTNVLDADERRLLERALGEADGPSRSQEDVRRLHALVTGRGGESVLHARHLAERFARRSWRLLDDRLRDIPDSIHKRFLRELVEFVIHRSR
jgi:geranylgeranyl diphosphate synthase type II